MNALRKCPFCGNKQPRLVETSAGHRAHCQNGLCATMPETTWEESAVDAIAAWNRRAGDSMNATTYQRLAMRTKNQSLDGELPILIAALGLCGEAGEVAEHVKKHVAHSQELNEAHLENELGDVLWYVALMCDCAGFDMAQVMEKNIQKLMERWPEGFDATLPQAAGE